MPNIITEDNMKEKLEYIGLDLENIPEFLQEKERFEYKPMKAFEENTYKVYKYVPISKIKILLTSANRLNTLREKYTNASSLADYLDSEKEENIIKHTIFLKMLKDVKIEEIEQVELEQKRLNKKIPFKVKYEENYLWQIYYSDISNTYFMMVPTNDLEYASFFYLLKKQIEINKTNKDEMIFVPISYQDYSKEYLSNTEISDLEKYLWFFTKEWPNVYEVYDKKENLTIQIIGDTEVIDKVRCAYSVKLKNKEEATKFYKLVKALFILQSNLPHYYNFKVKIDRYASITFEANGKNIAYDNLFNMLNAEYEKIIKELNIKEKERVELEENLQKLKTISLNNEREYLLKEKQIATYLECRKSFFGRVRYFFRSKKAKKKNKDKIVPNEEEKTVIEENSIEYVQKEYYTIEDVVTIYKKLDEKVAKVKNLSLDVHALENKISSLKTKIKNANLYIEEIDKHEKSIFEFWKFANKDENLMLNEGEDSEKIVKKKIEKSYNYKEDKEEIGSLIDKKQRNIFTKSDTDAIYIASTEVLEALNNMNNEELLQSSLDNLKQIAQNERILFDTDKLDIFGGMEDDNTKIKYLGNKKHRETAKDKIKILEINKNTTLDEYREKLEQISSTIYECIYKIKSQITIPIYISSNEEMDLKGLKIFTINPEDAINKWKEEKQIYLYKININEEDNVIHFTNSIYYDNYNKTLPLGIDVTSDGLIDLDRYKTVELSKDKFGINECENEFDVNTIKVKFYEYKLEKHTTN